MDIQFKRGNASNFNNVELLPGEPAFVLDEGKLYIGNGTTKVLINPDLPDISGLASKEYVLTAVNDLEEEINSRNYLTYETLTKIDGGEF